MNNVMLENAKKARDHAYAPYSKFHVGCCIRTTDNQLFSAGNVENASYSLTLCAETSAITTMVNAGHKQIAEMVVISNGNDICSPCGACRQRIREFAKPDALIHMYSVNGEMKTYTLAELLPLSFGPEHLESVNENK